MTQSNYETGDFIEITDVHEFPASYALSYDKPYEVRATHTCGSFEIKDDKGVTRWIDVTSHEFITKWEAE